MSMVCLADKVMPKLNRPGARTFTCLKKPQNETFSVGFEDEDALPWSENIKQGRPGVLGREKNDEKPSRKHK